MYRLRLNGCVQAYRLLNDRGRRFRASCDDDQRTVPCRGSFARGGVTMRDCSKSRAGFDRVLMAVAATFLTVTATSALAQTDPPRASAAELAIDAAVPRPEPANVPPPTASDFKTDATASVPDAAKAEPKAAEIKAPEKAAEPKPAEVVTAPAAAGAVTTSAGLGSAAFSGALISAALGSALAASGTDAVASVLKSLAVGGGTFAGSGRGTAASIASSAALARRVSCVKAE